MTHDWKELYVDTNMKVIGKHVALKFVDENGDEHEFRLNQSNVKWLRKALKRGIELAEMNEM